MVDGLGASTKRSLGFCPSRLATRWAITWANASSVPAAGGSFFWFSILLPEPLRKRLAEVDQVVGRNRRLTSVIEVLVGISQWRTVFFIAEVIDSEVGERKPYEPDRGGNDLRVDSQILRTGSRVSTSPVVGPWLVQPAM